MAYYRKLPSGLWQATIRDRSGKRHSFTDPLKNVGRKWATEQEALIARGQFRDPRLGETKIGAWYERRAAVRSTDAATRAKEDSLWRTHCEPKWARWPLNGPSRMEAQEWVNALRSTRRARHAGRAVTTADQDVPEIGAETICAAVHIMSSLYAAAMAETPPLVVSNPFARLDLPRIQPRAVEFLEHAEASALYEAADRIGSQWRTFIELGTEVGLRFGELAGLNGHRADWLRGRIEVIDVMTRTGLRQWPKSRRSHRVVPVPAHIMQAMSSLMAGRPRDALIFTAPAGGPVDDGNFRDRVWYPSLSAARTCGKLAPGPGDNARRGECGRRFCADPAHISRRFPPRIMRHTAASWLVIDGVPLYDVQALLGHESFATTQRYAHLAPDAHGRVLDSWARRRDASQTHDTRGARST